MDRISGSDHPARRPASDVLVGMARRLHRHSFDSHIDWLRANVADAGAGAGDAVLLDVVAAVNAIVDVGGDVDVAVAAEADAGCSGPA